MRDIIQFVDIKDDIVIRLRRIEAQVQLMLPDYLAGFPSIHAEAADEIERWRDLASRLANPTTHMEAVYDYGRFLRGE